MKLTNENYHSVEARKEYMGASQYKDFKKCPACALAKVNGELEEENTESLLIGSYIDAYFSNEMKEFSATHPEIFGRNGELKAGFKKAEEIIAAINADEKLKKYLSGEHQVIMTGEIAGVPFKIKIDSYHPGKVIVDQKIMKDMQPIWDEKLHCKRNFVEYWGYQYQAAIYQEIVRQNTGLRLPFYLAVTTKEKVPHKAILEIDQLDIDDALAEIEQYAPIYQKMKLGETEATSCGECDFCVSRTMVTEIKSYHAFDPYDTYTSDEE